MIRVLVLLLRAAALVGAGYSFHRASELVQRPPWEIDLAFRWYVQCFVLLAYAAWEQKAFRMRDWPSKALSFVRSHRLELGVFALVVGIGVLIRFYNYGVLPPTDFLCCEEHINGGVGGRILEGTRPMNYRGVRYSTAVGLWAFGENTDGLRLPFLLIGLLSVFPFYLLMREIVSVPAALAGTAVFASIHSHADPSWHAQPGILLSVLFTWTLVRAINTLGALWWLATGFLAASLSFEYETYKSVPPLAAVFLAGVVLRAIVSAVRGTAEKRKEFFRNAKAAVFPAVIGLLALAIGLAPIVAPPWRDERIYFASLNRQVAGRTESGWERYLSHRWEHQLRWVTDLYFHVPRPWVDETGAEDMHSLIDRVTSGLLLVALAVALLGFWRPWRTLFLMWFVGGSLAAALLSLAFAPWKLLGYLVPAAALIGLLADDLWKLASRRRWLAVLAALVLLVVVGAVVQQNLKILDVRAGDPDLQRAYAMRESEKYVTCHYLRGRPEDNFTVLSQWSFESWAFARPREDLMSQFVVWGDLYFVCHDLQGASAASGEETWPPPPGVNGPMTIALNGEPGRVNQWAKTLQRAIPDLGEPDHKRLGPGGVFELLAFELAPGWAASMRGVVATYSDATGRVRQAILDPSSLTLSDAAPGQSVRLTALLWVGANARPRSALVLAGGDQPEVRIDGVPAGPAPDGALLDLAQGWHSVEATYRTPAGSAPARLEWLGRTGAPDRTRRDEFFALHDASGWLHTRTLAQPSGQRRTVTRFDYEPHVAREDLIGVLATGSTNWRCVEDHWSATWHVPEDGTYVLAISSPGSSFEVWLDGAQVGARTQPAGPGRGSARYSVQVPAGPHRLELRFTHVTGDQIGGSLGLLDATDRPAQHLFSPLRIQDQRLETVDAAVAAPSVSEGSDSP